MRPLDEFASMCRRVDEALGAVGFVRDGHRPQWRSDREGRSWTARFSRDRRTRYTGEVRTRHTLGYRLRVDVTTSVKTRLYLVKRDIASSSLVRVAYRWRRLEVLPDCQGALAGFVAVAHERDWAARLLAQPEASRALAALVELRPAAGATSSVYFEPGCLYYASPRLQISDVTAERMMPTVESLAQLARAAEALPAPERPATTGRLQAFMKANPVAAAICLIAALGAVGLMGGLLLMAAAWLLLG